MLRLIELQYKRNDMDFHRGTFRVRGDTIDIFPPSYEDTAWRVTFFGDDIETISEFDPLTGERKVTLRDIEIFANSHYVTPRPTVDRAIMQIKEELKQRLEELYAQNKLIEAQRLEQRTTYDLEMLVETGMCKGIENYSRFLSGHAPGRPPQPCSNTYPKTPYYSSMNPMSPFPRSAACSTAITPANAYWWISASACPAASTTALSNSRNGIKCVPKPSSSQQPRLNGS